MTILMVYVKDPLMLCQKIWDVQFGTGKIKFVFNAHKDGIEIKLSDFVFLLMINVENMMMLDYVYLVTKDIV